jgi:hypothetical protein
VIQARNYNGGGFRDWRLPTKGELNLIYVNLKLGNLGEFSDGFFYWSSLEYSNYLAWRQRFSNGSRSYHAKYYMYAVLAVRTF